MSQLALFKVSLSEINTEHPQLVDELVMHAGIGFVIVYDDENTPLVLWARKAHVIW